MNTIENIFRLICLLLIAGAVFVVYEINFENPFIEEGKELQQIQSNFNYKIQELKEDYAELQKIVVLQKKTKQYYTAQAALELECQVELELIEKLREDYTQCISLMELKLERLTKKSNMLDNYLMSGLEEKTKKIVLTDTSFIQVVKESLNVSR